MKIIKKEQEKPENAEIPEDDSVQGKDVQVEKTPQGQRPRNRRPPTVPPTATKSIKPKEPRSSANIEPSNDEVSKKSKTRKDKKDKSFIEFLNSLLNLDL